MAWPKALKVDAQAQPPLWRRTLSEEPQLDGLQPKSDGLQPNSDLWHTFNTWIRPERVKGANLSGHDIDGPEMMRFGAELRFSLVFWKHLRSCHLRLSKLELTEHLLILREFILLVGNTARFGS